MDEVFQELRAIASRLEAGSNDERRVAGILYTLLGAMASNPAAVARLEQLTAIYSRTEIARIEGEHGARTN